MFQNDYLFQRVETVLIGEKANKLSSINKQLNAFLKGTYNDILERQGINPQAPKGEKIRALNNELSQISELIAESFPGIGVGYYSDELDAIVCYSPKALFNEKVGLSVGGEHVGRRCMKKRQEVIAVGSMVRGEILTCVAPIIRDGMVIGYTWSNELLEDIYLQMRKGSGTLFISPEIDPLLGLTGMLLICGSILLKLDKAAPESRVLEELRNIDNIFINLETYIRLFLNSLDLSVIVCDKGLTITFCSKNFVSLGIKNPDVFKGQSLQRFFAVLGFEQGMDMFKKLYKEDKCFLFERIDIKHSNINLMMKFLSGTPDDPDGTIIIFENAKNERLKEESIQNIEALLETEQLALSLAHEIHNPLTILRESLKVLSQRTGDKEFIPQFLQVSGKAIERMDKVTTSLLEVTRYKNPEFCVIDINLVLKDTAESIRQFAHQNNVIIVEDYQAVESKISGDPLHLETAFYNLFYNALQAMAEGGTLFIKTHDEPEGNVVYIEISDTGHGIPNEIKVDVFKLFFTTKKQGKGIGLSLAHNIICRHQGVMFFNSKINKGTTFNILLPKKIVYRLKDGCD